MSRARRVREAGANRRNDERLVAGALVGGPVGAVVGGAAAAVITSPVIGYPRYGYRCYYHDRYGYVHYHWCR